MVNRSVATGAMPLTSSHLTTGAMPQQLTGQWPWCHTSHPMGAMPQQPPQCRRNAQWPPPSIPPRECPMVATMVMAPSHPMDVMPNANHAGQEHVVAPDAATKPCTLVILPTNLLIICDAHCADDTMMFIMYY